MDIITTKRTKINDKMKNNNTGKWAKKKMSSEAIARKLYAAGYKGRAARMMECGSILEFAYCPECGRTHVKRANLCRDRLCPTCSWRLSLKRFGEMTSILNAMGEEINRHTVSMLTLTVKNVKLADLRETIKTMSKAWFAMTTRKLMTKEVWGWAKSLEITQNQKTGEFHPHFHVLIFWNGQVRSQEYRAKFQKTWQRCAKLDYPPIIDIRDAYSEKDGNEVVRAALESFKYITKNSTLIRMNLSNFSEFAEQIKNIRAISFGGEIRKIREKLGMDDRDQPDNSSTYDIICPECASPILESVARWAGCRYVDEKRGVSVTL